MDKVLTVKQIAEHLQVSIATIYSLVELGALPHSRVLNSIRIRQADLEAFLERGRSPSPTK